MLGMNSVIVISTFVAGITCSTSIALSQQPQEASAIRGVVHDAAGQPVYRARVRLTSLTKPRPSLFLQPSGGGFETFTAQDGTFRFDSILRDTYRLEVDKTGFSRGEFRSALTTGSGVALDEITITLEALGSVSGRVVDPEGTPMAGWQVSVLTRRYSQGERRLYLVATGRTNEGGEYEVQNLSPGDYFLFAQDQRGVMARAANTVSRNDEEEETGYVRAYYPNGTDEVQAAVVRLASGAKLVGYDIRLSKVPIVHLRGRVDELPELAWAERPTLILTSTESEIAATSISTTLMPDGTFDFVGVPRGNYTLVLATVLSSMNIHASQPVQVGDRNIEGVVMRFSSPATVSGKVFTDTGFGDGQENRSPIAGILATVQHGGFGGRSAVVLSDGSFAIPRLTSGKYYARLNPIPQGFYIASVKFNGQDALSSGFELAPGVESGELHFLLESPPASLSGSVRDENGNPVPGSTVLLLPDSIEPGTTYLARRTTTDQSGAFVFADVAPRKYSVLALERLEAGAELDPDLLRPYVGRTESIELDRGEAASLMLKEVHVSN